MVSAVLYKVETRDESEFYNCASDDDVNARNKEDMRRKRLRVDTL